MNLSFRIVVLVLLVTTLPLTGATYLIWQTWHSERLAQQQLNVRVLMERTKNQLLLTEQQAHLANSFLAGEDVIIRYLKTNNTLAKYGFLHAAVLDHFSTLHELRNDIQSIVLFSKDQNGQWQRSVELGEATSQIGELPTSQHSSVVWHECSPNALPCLQLSTPVYARSRRLDNAPIGLIVTQVAPESDASLTALNTGSMGLRYHLANAEGELYSPFDGLTFIRISQAPQTLTINNKKHFLQATPVSEDLWLIATVPMSSFDGSLRSVTLNLVLFCLLVTLLGVITLSLILRRQYLYPLQELRNALQEISEENYSRQIQPRSGELGGLIRVFETMRERIQQSSSQIRNLAYKDPLTGLPNRRSFSEILQQHTAKNEHKLALLYLDLDHFKHVNDSLGHMAGDELIQGVAQRIKTCLRRLTDTLRLEPDQLICARVGGDEFLILMTNLQRSSDAARCAQMIIDQVQESFELHGHRVTVGASIGVATFPDDGDSASELLRTADLAMYHAKSQGKNNYKFYTPELNEDADEQLLLKSKLRDAIAHDRLALYYQPKVDLITGEIVGAEALARWNDSELGDISPERFLKVAEEHGLIGEFTGWVITESCRQLNQWKDLIGLNFQLAINVSYRDISGPYLPIVLQEALREYDVGPENFILEITESGLLSGDRDPVTILNEIRGLGCDIALDDFGTGYSSLSYLRHLPVDEIKVDRSFILDLADNKPARHIIEAIAKLGKTLNMQITAEGIETLDQLRMVTDLGCDFAQGALFSMPMPAEEFVDILEKKREPDWDRVFQSLDENAPEQNTSPADSSDTEQEQGKESAKQRRSG